MRREIRRRAFDGFYSVWQRQAGAAWECIGVFSERENAEACRDEGPVWPWARAA